MSGLTVLDREGTTARHVARRRRGRCFLRVFTGLQQPGDYRFLTLTSRDGGSASFSHHWRLLVLRLRRRGLLREYVRVPELSRRGERHDHIVFRGSYIEWQLLSHLWEKIHGAYIVDIRMPDNARYGSRAVGKRKLAGYLAKHLGKQPAARMAASRGWAFVAVADRWREWRSMCSWNPMRPGLSFQSICYLWDSAASRRGPPQSDSLILSLLDSFTRSHR